MRERIPNLCVMLVAGLMVLPVWVGPGLGGEQSPSPGNSTPPTDPLAAKPSAGPMAKPAPQMAQPSSQMSKPVSQITQPAPQMSQPPSQMVPPAPAMGKPASPMAKLAPPITQPSLQMAQPASAAPIAKPLLAHWRMDEPDSAELQDASGHQFDATAQPRTALEPVEGVFGGGMKFSGQHMVRTPIKLQFTDLKAVTFSAWVQPTDLSSYREIFRKEDGDQRVLFSFQNNGTILSLGLNIGGYVECDAPIKPEAVLDGAWHHCAATYDGQWMRVYLDGREIGSLHRPGRITAGGPAPGCIGSSQGGECFQGLMDDLRIYAEALSPEEIARLYREGLEALAAASKQAGLSVDAFFVRGASFADSLAQSRQKLHQLQGGQVRLDKQTAALFQARLQEAFPEEYQKFIEYTGRTPAAYLVSLGNDFHLREAGRLMELLLEYKPLTEDQWRKQTPQERQRWAEADQIASRFEALRTEGEKAAYKPDWIELMLEAGRRIAFRPVVHEAVAPYVRPETPPTRDLSAQEAQQLLERDWLHQADGHPTPERIRQEIQWARQLAERIAAAHPGKVDFTAEMAQLAQLEQKAQQIDREDQALYFQVRRVKRQIMFRNPLLTFEKLVFVDGPFPQGSEWQHETRHRLGYMAVPGGRLLVLEGLRPDGHVRQLAPQAPLHGSFWRPDVSWDGQKILFCFKPHNEKSFHLYEIGADGSGLRQLTDGPYDDLDPIYLPDEKHILFTTTRGHTYVRCMPPTNAFVLARCDRDGRNIYLISQNNEPDYTPSVMHDGRIIYTRWEYTDKPLWRAQGLWTVNPDGTQVQTFWGNQSVWPDLLKDARSIPGSRRVMFTGSAHHNWFSGSVGIIDPDKGFNFPDGLTKVTADVPWPESGNGPVDPIESPRYHSSGRYVAYYSPYPLSEQDFLVSANRGDKFVLYLMDVDGNRELIYEGVYNIFHAMPLAARPKPPVIVDRVDWPSRDQREQPKDGVIYSANVYYGAPPQLEGKARFLRILNIEHKTYTYWHRRPYISTGPVVSAVQSEGVKRILGTVPIEPDGSVSFYAPSGLPLHFQLLDAEGRALQTMRSFVGLMPGEMRGCLGCHESHSRTPPLRTGLALRREPSRITPPPWGDESISYGRFVQPVLDRYCGKCHQGNGEARKVLDLTERPGFLHFTEPYLTLIGRPTWGQPYQAPSNPPPGWGIADMIMVEAYDQRDPAGYRTPAPMTKLSYKSRLVEICSSGKHYDVRVDPLSLQRIIAWVDAMCPFWGSEEVRQEPDPVFQGVDWLAIRPRVKTAPTIRRPGPVD